MLDREDQSAERKRSLLSLGDALRASSPAAPSRLAQALDEARARTVNAGAHRAATARDAQAANDAAPPHPTEAGPPPLAAGRSADGDAAQAQSGPEPLATPPAAVAEIGFQPAPEMEGRWEPMIDPAKVVSGILRSKRIIVACTIAGALIGVLVALSTPKTYFSAAELLADPRDLNLVERELTQGGISNEATLAIVDNQVRILKSGMVMANVVRRLNLDADPEFNGTGESGGITGYISKLRSLFSSGDDAGDPGRRTALAIMTLGKALSVERGGRTFVVLVGATTRSPEKSALIANTTAEVFLERYGQIQSDSAGRAAGELTGKLDELRSGLEAAERKVETFKAENDLVDAQGRLITDDEILKLNEQLSIARARTLEISARAASVRGADADAILGGVLPEELTSATIQGLRTQYSTLKGEADRLAARLGPRHPQLQALEAQLGGARQQIEVEMRRVVASTQTELKRAVQLEQELSARLAQLKVRQGGVSGELVTLRELEREATAKRAVYESYLLRAKETGEQQGINSANISVISPASAPLESSSTSRSVIAMAGTGLGFLAGVLFGGLRGAWDGFRDNVRGRQGRPRSSGARRRTATMFDEAASAVPDTASAPASQGASAHDRGYSVPEDTPTQAQPVQADAAAPTRSQTMHRPYPNEFAPYEQPPQQAQPVYPFAPAYAQPPMGPPVFAGGYPAYPQQPMPPAYPQAYGYPQPMPGQGQPWHGQAGPHWQTPAMGYPQQPYPQPPAAPAWAQPAAPAWAQPPAAPQQTYAEPEPAAAPRPAAAARPAAEHEPSPIEEIRASLRECRDAIRELADQRSRRRYF